MLHRIYLRQSVKHGGRVSNTLRSPVDELLTWQTNDVFSTTCGQAFMMPDAEGDEIPVPYGPLLFCSFVMPRTVCTEESLLTAE